MNLSSCVRSGRGSPITLATDVLDRDAAWFVFEQRCESAGKPYAHALVQARFRRGRERVATRYARAAIGAAHRAAPRGGSLVGRLGPGVRPAP